MDTSADTIESAQRRSLVWQLPGVVVLRHLASDGVLPPRNESSGAGVVHGLVGTAS